MTTPSVRAASPPGQEDVAHNAGKLLGTCRTSDGIVLSFRKWDDELVLIRPSAGGRRGTKEDIAATVTHAKGKITIEWNDWHKTNRPKYMPEVDAWTRRQMGAS